MSERRMIRWAIHGLLWFAVVSGSASAQQPSATPDRLPFVESEESIPEDFAMPLPKSMPHPEGEIEALPIDWPTVLRLVRASSLDIELAVEKVAEANTQLTLARQQWIPSLRVGTSWLHHDGRIQDIPGQILEASKSSLYGGSLMQLTVDPQKVTIDVSRARLQVFARSGELDRATRETLQEASLAYVDLVAAQAGAAISIEIAQRIQELYDRSKNLYDQDLGSMVGVLTNKTKLDAQLINLNRARERQLAASARLVQLLNLEPGTRLFADDERLSPVMLVDESRPEQELISQALQQGPGLGEVVALISALQEQERELRRKALWPTVSFRVGTGGFGGGIGSTYDDFDVRTDYGMDVYWDVMKIVGTRQTRELFESKRRQAALTHDQVTAKLAAGIIITRNGARKAKEQIEFAQQEIENSIRLYLLNQQRLKAAPIEESDNSFREVLQAIGFLGNARMHYLESVIAYNTAQIRMQYLIGFDPCADPALDTVEVVDEPDEAGPSERGNGTVDKASAYEPPIVSAAALMGEPSDIDFVKEKGWLRRRRAKKMSRSARKTGGPYVEPNSKKTHPRKAFRQALRAESTSVDRTRDIESEARRPSLFRRFVDRFAGSERKIRAVGPEE